MVFSRVKPVLSRARGNAKTFCLEADMNYRKMLLGTFVICSVCFVLVSCGGSARNAAMIDQTKTLYLQNNIHAQEAGGKYRGSYSNWVELSFGHIFVPVNSVVNIELGRNSFDIIDRSTGKRLEMEYDQERMRMPVEEYIRIITATAPVNFDNLPDIDKKGIKDGKPYIGMTKQGIRIALGYPARHRTASLEADTWVYWRGRFGTRAVDFNESGKVERIR